MNRWEYTDADTDASDTDADADDVVDAVGADTDTDADADDAVDTDATTDEQISRWTDENILMLILLMLWG